MRLARKSDNAVIRRMTQTTAVLEQLEELAAAAEAERRRMQVRAHRAGRTLSPTYATGRQLL